MKTRRSMTIMGIQRYMSNITTAEALVSSSPSMFCSVTAS